MTFDDIILKIFRANFRKYLAYFICSSFNIMVFFTYANLYTNEKLIGPAEMTHLVSSMIFPSTGGIILFSVFFIIFTFAAFLKSRKTEFGLFLTLGMTQREIRRIILMENSLIAGLSLLLGLAGGTIFSRIYFWVIDQVIQISGITYQANLTSYLYTIVFFVALYTVVILGCILSTYSYRITELLKEKRKKDKEFFCHPIWAIIGIMFVGVFPLMMWYSANDLFLPGFGLFLAGVFLLHSNLVQIIELVRKSFKKIYYSRLLLFRSIEYSFGQSQKILFASTILVCIIVLFNTINLDGLFKARSLAEQNNPFDFALVQASGKNNVSGQQLMATLNSQGNQVADKREIKIISMLGLHLFVLSDQELNQVLDTNIQVQPSHFLNLFQFVDDGYPHNTTEIMNLDLLIHDQNVNFSSQGSMHQVLFNNAQYFYESRLIILNEKDFLTLWESSNSFTRGTMTLVNFRLWSDSQKAVEELQRQLNMINANTPSIFKDTLTDQYKLQAASKIGTYQDNMRAWTVSLFMDSFIGVLFLLAIGIAIHFKLLTEFEIQTLKMKKLYKIGITKIETAKMVAQDLKLLFFLPSFLGILFACVLVSSVSAAEPITVILKRNTFALLFGCIYLLIQKIYYFIYKCYYTKKMLSKLKYERKLLI